LITLPGNIKTHAHLTKIHLVGFLEILKMNKIRERRSHTCFYTSALITKLHPVYMDNLSLDFDYYKKFYIFTPRLHF